MTLKYDFPSYTVEGGRRLIDFLEADCAHPDFDGPDGMRLLREEIARTARETERAAPHRIERGSLTREEADRQLVILAAIAADLAAEAAHLKACRAHLAAGGDWMDLPDFPSPTLGRGTAAQQQGEGPAFSWEDKLHLLRREIHFRRRYDADRVARGRTTAAAAAEQRERLEAVQHKYWWDMFTWSSPTAAPAGTPAWRAEVREHTARLELGAGAPCSPAEAGAQDDEHQEAMPV